jgi:menaquinone-dependent protoporphyrinogen oxidase
MTAKPPRVLIAYGSKRGGTRDIAAAIAETMREQGIDAELADAAEVRSVAGYDALVIGGALYMARWHRAARKLITRNVDDLRMRPVWLFSSGPLDDSANKGALPPTPQVFGGALAADVTGLPASAMAKTMAGDWRDWDCIRGWAKRVARHVLTRETYPVMIAPPPSRAQHWLLTALCLVTAVTAIGGGATLALRPDGSLMEASPAMLSFSPFSSFLVPGLLLLIVIGFGNAFASFVVARRLRSAPYVAALAGAALFIWISVEMILLRTLHWLQFAYLAVAALILFEAWQLYLPRRRHAQQMHVN